MSAKSIPSHLFGVIYTVFMIIPDSKLACGAEWPCQPFQILHQPERLCAVGREHVLPLVPDQGRRMCARNGGWGARHLCVPYTFSLARERRVVTFELI